MGMVVDASTGYLLADVQVSSGVPNSPYATSTETGQYKLGGLNPGPYRIAAHHPDRDLTIYRYVFLAPGETIEVDQPMT